MTTDRWEAPVWWCPYTHSHMHTDTNLQLPEKVEPGRGLHLLGMQVEGEDEDGDDHRRHDLQRNLGVHHTAGGRHTQTRAHHLHASRYAPNKFNQSSFSNVILHGE